MDKSRVVNTFFWNDNWVIDLDPHQKLLYLYLLTNPNTNLAGIYQMHVKKMAFDVGLDIPWVQQTLTMFEESDKIIYRHGYIIVRNFANYQNYNPSMLKNIRKTLDELPDELKNDSVCTGCIQAVYRLCTPHAVMERESESKIESENKSESESESDSGPRTAQELNYFIIKKSLMDLPDAQKLQMFLPFRDKFRYGDVGFVDVLLRKFLKEIVAKNDLEKPLPEYRGYFVNWFRSKTVKDKHWVDEIYSKYRAHTAKQQQEDDR